MKSGPHILIVDDHRDIREELSGLLSSEGFRVSAACDGPSMRRILKASKIDLIVLDLMLPGDDGLQLCREIRAKDNTPIVMLTAKGEEFDRVLGLELGADDYLSKPFSGRELIARIKAVLRRTQTLPEVPSATRPQIWSFDRWKFDQGARNLRSPDNVIVSLSTAEYNLLKTFVERPKMVLTRDQLLDLTKGRFAENIDRSIDTQVSRLRRKIEADPRDPKIIKTVWGGGYVFSSQVNSE